MKNWIKYGAVFFSIIFLISVSVLAQQPPKRVLTVAFPEAEGINEIYSDGTYGGVVYDWLLEISKYTGWEYEFILGDSSELLAGMIACDYDIMGGMFLNESLAQYFCYPQYIMGSSYAMLIYRKDNESIRSFDINTLNGKTIGALKRSTPKLEQLDYFLTLNDLDCEIVYYEDDVGYEACLENREVDLLLGSDVHMTEGYNVAAKFASEPYYLVTAKDEPELCDELNAAMTEIYAANPNFAHELYNKYFPDTYINSISFSEEDLQFIEDADPIRVSVVAERHPVHYIKEGKHQGIVPDIFNLISQRTGLVFEFIPSDSYGGVIDLVKQGKADVIGCFMDDEYAAQRMGLSLTKQYAALDEVVLRNKQVSFPNEGLTLALPEGRSTTGDKMANEVLICASYEECLEAVNSGKADYTRLPSSYMEDLYLKDYYANLTLVAADNGDTPLSIALPKPVPVSLYSVLSKAVNNLSEKEIDSVLSKNLVSMGETNISLKSIFYTQPMTVIVVCVSFLTLIMAIFLLVLQFKMKNRMMELKLEKAEETGRAKSAFLSRMSHEIRTPMNAIIGLTNLTRMSDEATPPLRKNLEKIGTSAQFLLSLVNDILDMSKIESDKMRLEILPFRVETLAEEMESMFGLQCRTKGIHLKILCQLDDKMVNGDELRLKQVLANLLSNACKFTNSGGNICLEIRQVGREATSAQIQFSVKDDGIGIGKDDLERIFDSFEQASKGPRNSQGTGLGLSISSNLVRLMGGELQVKSELAKGAEFYFTLFLPISKEQPVLRVKEKRDPESLRGLRLLLAEDNDLNAEIATALLEMQQITVERAQDGQEAVELFVSHPVGYYAAILMDIQMPVKDGLTATADIRAMNREDAESVPIIAMTANTFQEDRESAALAGMTGFIPKPFDVGQLYEALEQALPNTDALS